MKDQCCDPPAHIYLNVVTAASVTVTCVGSGFQTSVAVRGNLCYKEALAKLHGLSLTRAHKREIVAFMNTLYGELHGDAHNVGLSKQLSLTSGTDVDVRVDVHVERKSHQVVVVSELDSHSLFKLCRSTTNLPIA